MRMNAGISTLVLLLVVSLCLSTPGACNDELSGEGCTAFGVVGAALEGGGALIARNRDKSDRGLQVMVRRTSPSGIEYLGITSLGHRTLTAGVNERGLIVVNTAASSDDLPRATPSTSCDALLGGFSSVDEALAWLRAGGGKGPINFLLGDHRSLAVVEIARGDIRIVRIESGALFHTNHYFLEGMERFNRKDSESSECRLARIRDLVGTPSLSMPGAFMDYSRDHYPAPGPSSICRHPYLTAGKKQSGTLASTIFLVRGGAPRIFVALGEPCLTGYASFSFHDSLPESLRSGRAFLLAEEMSRAYWLINRDDPAVVRALSDLFLQRYAEAEHLMAVSPVGYSALAARLVAARRLVNRGRFRDALRLLRRAALPDAG